MSPRRGLKPGVRRAYLPSIDTSGVRPVARDVIQTFRATRCAINGAAIGD